MMLRLVKSQAGATNEPEGIFAPVMQADASGTEDLRLDLRKCNFSSEQQQVFITKVYELGTLQVGARFGQTTGAYSSGQEPSWFSSCVKELDRLKLLQRGWDSYDAEPPNAWSLHQARQVLDDLHCVGLKPESIVPSAEHGVGIVFGAGEKFADIECLNSGSILAATSDGHGTIDVWEVGDDHRSMENAIERIRDFIL